MKTPKEYGNTSEENLNKIAPIKSGNINTHDSPNKMRRIIETILIILIFIINYIPFPLIFTEVELRLSMVLKLDMIMLKKLFFIIYMTPLGNVIFFIFVNTSINLAVLVVIDIKII